MKWGPKHKLVHKSFLDLHPEFEPVEIYKTFCRLLKLGDEAIERGIGKLFSEGKLKPKERRPKKSKRSKSGRGEISPDDFR